MRNDNEIVYRQNMTRNEAVHILKAIAFPIAVFCLGLFTINMFGEFGKKLICPLSGAMWDVGVLVALLMPNVPKTAIRKIRDHGISVDETIFQINVPKEEIKA